MDLRILYPRSIREKFAGYVHFGRMIDKCWAVHAGMEGEYMYPCPMDERLLQFAGISSEAFSPAVQGKTDQEMVEWFLATATPHTRSEIEV
jgi:hypothetical protein